MSDHKVTITIFKEEWIQPARKIAKEKGCNFRNNSVSFINIHESKPFTRSLMQSVR